MTKKRGRRGRSADDQRGGRDQRESGEPGGGKGRRDEVGPTGVYPQGAQNIPGDAEVRMAGKWGGGDYEEAGGSELEYRDGQLLGGLDAGPDGGPVADATGGGERGGSILRREAKEDDEGRGGESAQSGEEGTRSEGSE